MTQMPIALQFLFLAFAAWVNRQQQDVIDYLQEDNRVMRDKLGGGRLRFTTAERLEAKGKALGRKLLRQFARIVSSDTMPDETAGRTKGRVACRERLGGLLNYHYQEAA